MKIKHKVMLDGIRVGTNLEVVKGSLEVSNDEVLILNNILIKAGAYYAGNELTLEVKNKSTMLIVIRRHFITGFLIV